jgi:hypothetical protein
VSVRRSLTAAVVVAAAVGSLAAAPAAGAAARSVPQLFFGADWDGKVATKRTPLAARDKAFGQMAASGVESVRTNFEWGFGQHVKSYYDFRRTDPLVLQAVNHGLDVLPVVILAPEWARRDKFTAFSPPRDPKQYAAYLTALINRYGPNGSFWAAYPQLPVRPIRTWQIWNEPHVPFQWTIPKKEDWVPGYARLLKVAYTAAKQADPGSTVVLAGLANFSWTYLQRLYKVGHIGGYYDVADIHPYTRSAKGVLTLVQRFRKVMSQNGDAQKPVWVTELGRPAAKGRQHTKNRLETTDAGMARFLSESYRALAESYSSPQSGVTRAYWYDWASTYTGSNIFNYSGLYAWDGHSGFRARPALGAYRQSARQYEGCAKTQTGDCVTSP